MPLKRGRGKGKDAEGGTKTETRNTVMCRFITPGPQYQLKTLVGYRNHCISRYRNPAYTLGSRCDILEAVKSPGPKYMIKQRRPKGFTFGHAAKRREIGPIQMFGPGPKYKLPDVRPGPFFSIKWKTKLRKIGETPGPYYIKPIADAPAFSIGLPTTVEKSVISAVPYSYSLNLVKPRAPMYTIGTKQTLQLISEGPGPMYTVSPPKPSFAFSFGVKHSECAPPYITECDKQD